jgi:hypothetical protein
MLRLGTGVLGVGFYIHFACCVLHTDASIGADFETPNSDFDVHLVTSNYISCHSLPSLPQRLSSGTGLEMH